MNLADIRSPFPRLRRLLADAPPPDLEPIDLTIGEPKTPLPELVMPALTAKADQFHKYPPIRGTMALREAIGRWHERRYGLSADALDPEHQILPVCGSREGLFSILFPLIERGKASQKPAVLLPNPFYQVYAAAALAAGAEPVFLECSEKSGHLPDLDRLAEDEELLARTVALYLCSPANPQGVIAGPGYLSRAIELARAYDFFLIGDECYSEIYTSSPPPGVLEVAHRMSGSLSHVIAFNSLSKRSGMAGLRSGFCAGEADLVARFALFRNVACPQMPLPIQHASAALWSDEAHVEAARAYYQANFEAGEQILRNTPLGFQKPGGTFFIWLDMSAWGGGEDAAVTIWKHSAVRVLPGAYLTHAPTGGANAGEAYIRLALVHDLETTREAFKRIASVFV